MIDINIDTDICNEILKDNELKYYNINDKIFEKVLNELEQQTSIIINKDNPLDATNKTIHLLNEENKISYIDCLYEILKKYNYNMNIEIRNAIFTLGNLKSTRHNKETIKKVLTSPIIQDVSYKRKGRYEIYSEKFGKINFLLASTYFKKNKELTKYINETILNNECHSHAYYMSKLFKDYYSITSLCKYYFKGKYYHSYTYDKETNLIFDLCCNAVFSKESYDKLLNPIEVSTVLNKDIPSQLDITEYNTNHSSTMKELLKIALFKQYLNLKPEENLEPKLYVKNNR